MRGRSPPPARARRREPPLRPARCSNRECDRMSDTQEPQPPKTDKDKAKVAYVPGQPLPRLWKTEPDPEEDSEESLEEPGKAKKKVSKDKAVAAPASKVPGKPKATASKPAKPKPKKKKVEEGEDGEKRVLLEETRPVRYDRVAAAGSPGGGRPDHVLFLDPRLDRLRHDLLRLRRFHGQRRGTPVARCDGHAARAEGIARARGAVHARPGPRVRQARENQGVARDAQAGRLGLQGHPSGRQGAGGPGPSESGSAAVPRRPLRRRRAPAGTQPARASKPPPAPWPGAPRRRDPPPPPGPGNARPREAGDEPGGRGAGTAPVQPSQPPPASLQPRASQPPSARSMPPPSTSPPPPARCRSRRRPVAAAAAVDPAAGRHRPRSRRRPSPQPPPSTPQPPPSTPQPPPASSQPPPAGPGDAVV